MFGVNASASSLVGGEFVCAFIPDPTDKPPLRNADQWIKAHQGSVTSSWWRSVDVRGPCPPQMLYTSFEENEIRYSSPGRFVMAVINPPTDVASFSLSLDWEVTFKQPSLETEEVEDGIYTLEVDSRLSISDGNAGQAFDPYLRVDLVDDTGTAYLTPDQFSPVLPPNVYVRLPHPKTLNSDTGSTGAPENAIVTHMGRGTGNNSNRIAYYYTENGTSFIQLINGQGVYAFSIRPVADSINEASTVYEEDDLGQGNLNGVVLSARASQPSMSGLAYKTLPSGKTLSFSSSRRF